MNRAEIARMAAVNPSDVTNYLHPDTSRKDYVSPAKRARIAAALETHEAVGMSKAQQVLAYLKSGRTLTPQQSLRWFGLHALSQTVTKLRARGHNIVNINAGKGPHLHAEYKLEDSK